MRRFLALLLICCFLLPLSLAACSKDKGDTLRLFEGGSAVLVYDDSLLTSQQVKSFVSSVEKATGVTLTTKREYGGEGAKLLLGNLKHENCQAVTKDLRVNDWALQISGGDYVIGAVTAESLQKAMKYFLDTILPGAKDGVLSLTPESDYLYTGIYKSDTFTIGGVALGRMQIVIPSSASVSEFRTAVLLQQNIKTLTGYELAIKKNAADASAEGRFLIGTALCTKISATAPHSWAIAVSGTTMEIVAESYYGWEAAQNALEKQIFTATAANKTLTDETAYSGTGSATDAVLSHDGDIRVMFHNIHGSCNATEFPLQPVAEQSAEVYLEYLPDVLGLQECSPQMRSQGNISQYLAAIGYTEVDVTSHAGFAQNSRVNFTPLFYRAETVEVLHAGFFCFNYINYSDEAYADMLQGEDPSTLLTTNKKGDSKNRSDDSKGVTFAVFRSKATGNIFLAASTHLWWENDDPGDKVTRRIQLAYLKDLLLSEAASYLSTHGYEEETMPILVGGDYNASIKWASEDLSVMTRQSPLTLSSAGTDCKFQSANTIAPSGKKMTVSSHHEYATWNNELEIYESPKTTTNDVTSSLDHIYLNYSSTAKAMYAVSRTAVADDLYSYLSSDHCPVMVDLTFTDAAPKQPNA